MVRQITGGSGDGERDAALRQALARAAELENAAAVARAENAVLKNRLQQATVKAQQMERAAQVPPPVPIEMKPDAPKWWQSRGFLSVAIVLGAALAGFGIYYADPFHAAFEGWKQVWWTESAPVQAPVAPKSQTAAPQSQQTKALSRLSEALGQVPTPSVPLVMKAANQILNDTGEPACSVETPDGQLSLVISGDSKAGAGSATPLLTALSRCANAVEQITKPDEPEKP